MLALDATLIGKYVSVDVGESDPQIFLVAGIKKEFFWGLVPKQIKKSKIVQETYIYNGVGEEFQDRFPMYMNLKSIKAVVNSPAVNNNIVGCSCQNCKEIVPFSEPNQEDGSFICYECRTNPWR